MLYGNVTFSVITSNFTCVSSYLLLITTSSTNSSIALLNPSIVIMDGAVKSVRYSMQLDPGNYYARFQNCLLDCTPSRLGAHQVCQDPWDSRYATEIAFQIPQDGSCYLQSEPLFISNLVPAVVTLVCSCDTLVLTSYWLSAQQNSLINLGPSKQGGMQLLVLVPYNETQEVSVMQGALIGYEHVPLPDIPSLTLHFTTTRPLPVFSNIQQTNNVITASIEFSHAMVFQSVSSNWLLIQDSSSVVTELSVDTPLRLRLQITFVVPGSVNITLKSGVCYSMLSREYNLASDMIEVSYAEELFSFNCSFETGQEVTHPDLEVSLSTDSVVSAIWPSHFKAENCEMLHFSSDIVGGNTLVVIGLHVINPGEFSLVLPARSVQLLTGQYNARWSLTAVFVEGSLGTVVRCRHGGGLGDDERSAGETGAEHSALSGYSFFEEGGHSGRVLLRFGEH